jgi:AraC-like DNA-binding protein
MGNFHMHDYYEISLILSGKVKVLLSNSASEGDGPRLVLTSPNTPHFVACDEKVLYRRLNFLFAPRFIETYGAEFATLLSVFGKEGRIITVNEEQCERYKEIAERIKSETDKTRKKLISLYLLSLISETQKDELPIEAPSYVTEALRYINEHYGEKIVAEELAWKLGIGRTTLMTAFKNYTGSTLQEHILRYRLTKAIKLLSDGTTEQVTAESCGFNDTCTLIRSFKKVFGVTPAQYIKARKR